MLLNEGRGENYKYYVEKLKNGNRVFLKRPGQLNKGFDFTVNLEGFPDNPPSHDQMFSDYYLKKEGYLFNIEEDGMSAELNQGSRPDKLGSVFEEEDYPLTEDASLSIKAKDKKWEMSDEDVTYVVLRDEGDDKLDIYKKMLS